MTIRKPTSLKQNESAFLAEVEQRLGTFVKARVMLHLLQDPSVPNLSDLSTDERNVLRELLKKHDVDLPTSPP